MYGLTLENIGKPIAKIVDENQTVYLADYKSITRKVNKKFTASIDLEDHAELFSKLRGRKKTTVQNNVYLLLTDPEAIEYIDDEDSLSIYRAIRGKEKQLSKPTTEMTLQEDSFMIYPNPDPKQFECLFIVGQSGSGKSYIALKYSEYYHQLFPNNDIYLVSSLDNDATLDQNKHIIRLPLESFMQYEPTLDEFRDSLVIFDDFETVQYTSKPLYKKITALISQVVSKGRHTNTRSVVIRHKFQNTADACGQLILSECTHMIVYPRTCSKANLKLVLETHGVLTSKQVSDVLNMPTRWICYGKGLPNYIISENEIRIL